MEDCTIDLDDDDDVGNEFFVFFFFCFLIIDSHLFFGVFHRSLCVADFSFCVLVMPFTAYRFLNDRNYFGDEDVMCISTYYYNAYSTTFYFLLK